MDIQLIVALIAFIFAATLIPLSKMKRKGRNVQIWRLIALSLLVAAAALAMFAPAINGK